MSNKSIPAENDLNMFKTIVQNLSESVWIGDENERTIYANPTFCNKLGYTLDEIIGEKSYIFWDEESKKTVKQHNKKRKTGETSKYEGNLLTKDGEKVPVLLSGVPREEGGTIGIMTDLRGLKSLEMLAEYEKAIESSSIVFIMNDQGSIFYYNHNFSSILGYDSEELLSQYYYSIIHPDISSEKIDNLWNTIKSKKIWKGEIKNTKKDGGYCWVFYTMIPILDENSNLKEYFVIGQDITKQKDYEEEIKNYQEKEIENKNKLIEELNELSKLKNDFLNIASHELRTPMTTIKGYISMILEGDLGDINDETKLYLEKVYKNTDRLIGLINDMLDIEKLESGKMQFSFEDLKFESLLDDVYQDMNQIAKNNNQNLFLDIKYDSFTINSDYNKLLQVFTNLVGNAVKFTPENGSISIISYQEGDFIKTAVVDSGIGIPDDKLDNIFEKFGQVKDSFTRDINGTGLGLPIVKSIVESLGGNINVDSKKGEGSKFEVSIPIK